MVNASIITIGDELLIGQVIDTNSAWMANALNEAGIWLKRRVAVGDNKEDIVRALEEESNYADIILITGGLGPTADDITKPVLCDHFGGKLVMNEEALENVKKIFARYNRPLLAVNVSQAEVPDVCTVINNAHGTAPGMWFEKDGKVYVSMPGVPHEMKEMMAELVIPKLSNHFTLPFIVSRTLLTAGIGESFLADLIKDVEASLPAEVKLAYLPNYGMVRLRLTAIGTERETIEATMDRYFNELRNAVQDYLVVSEDITLPDVVGKLLKMNNQTVATAESCTGGYIAHLLTAKAGASAFYKGSVVSYANEVKENVLKVHSTTLQQAGAVSEETVRAMVAGGLPLLQTDYVIAVSGIMGPDGGSTEKPVGTVWIAVGNKDKTITEKLSLRYNRSRNIEMTANYGLNILRKFILEQHDKVIPAY